MARDELPCRGLTPEPVGHALKTASESRGTLHAVVEGEDAAQGEAAHRPENEYLGRQGSRVGDLRVADRHEPATTHQIEPIGVTDYADHHAVFREEPELDRLAEGQMMRDGPEQSLVVHRRDPLAAVGRFQSLLLGDDPRSGG
jgi:hypothetical protein